MTVLAITCDNCGAKYKLPESFTGNQAKCQKCGSVIDVARQRAAAAGPAATAAAPAAAKPAAAARPAIDRSKEAPKPAERPAAAARSERTTRRGKDDGDAGDKAAEGKGRRGRPEREAKKGSPMPLIAAGVGLVAIAVVVVFLMQGGDKTKTDTAKTDAPAANAAPQQPAANEAPKAEAPKADAAKTETPKVDAPKADAPKADAPKAETPPAEAPKPADAAPTDASTPSNPGAPKMPWERMAQPPTSMEGVADPKNYGEVQWPAGFDEAKKKELQELAQEAANDTGIRGIRATKKLVAAGYGGLYAIVEQLRLIDYKTPEGNSTGFALNKALEELTGGQNMRFATVEASETVTHLKAEWNTRTVRAWLQVCGSYPDEAAFTKARAERLKKAAGDAK